MKISGMKLLGSLVVALSLSGIVASSAFAAPPTPTPRGNTYGYGMMGGYNLDGVAKLLGETRADVISQLQQRKTLAQLAEDKGVDRQKLVDALVAPYKDELQLRVKYEYITQDQADAQLQATTERINTAINTSWGSNGNGGYWSPWGNGFGGMMGGFGGMMGGFGGVMNGFGGMIGGFGNSFGGYGGMMGGYVHGGMMGWGWNR